ncbi:MAG TPA: efflux RND transporter periplasmic adaptor subunit [Chthonomonadales bacterium]|nr:efflux RND transporter periplasmic adaptor subunit [Chthonomonadales bacterium]
MPDRLLRPLFLLAVMVMGAVPSARPALAGVEGAGHVHGPDGGHIAVTETADAPSVRGIISHHDLKITDTRQPGPDGEGVVVPGCEVHSTIHRKGDPQDVVHRELNAFEPENGVYGAHMSYTEPGEYVLVQRIVLPDKREMTLEFPIWVPDPAEEAHHHHFPLWPVLGGVGFLLLVGGAFFLGKRSGIRAAATLLLLVVGSSLYPIIRAQAHGGADHVHAEEPAQEAERRDRAPAQEEAGHAHGPDGQHMDAHGGAATPRAALRAFPTADGKEYAVQTREHFRFRLSIENEELAPPDPDVVTVTPAARETIGLTVVEARARTLVGDLITTGQVRRSPDGAVMVNARVSGRVLRVGATPGQRVPAGHVVAMLDSPEIAEAQAALARAQTELPEADAARSRALALVAEAQAGVERAQADAASAEAKVENQRRVLERQRTLASAGAFAYGPVDEARSRAAAAEGELRATQAALSNLEAQAGRLTEGVRVGVVARKELEEAQTAREQGRARVTNAEQQVAIARAALGREETIQRQGLRNAREVQQAEADLESAQLAARSAQSVVVSQGRALEAMRGSASEADAVVARARSTVQSAQSRLRLLGATPGGGSQVAIAAPIGGVVESRTVSVGETVAAGQPLATIINTQTVWVESDVFERDLSRVRVGQTVTIAADALPGSTFQGVISSVGAEVHPEMRAVRVRTVVANRGGRLKPNMFVRVVIGAGTGSAILIPQEAVQEDDGEMLVFVEVADGQFRRRTVQTGATIGDQVVITGGIRPNDRVVTRGAYQLLAQAKRGA